MVRKLLLSLLILCFNFNLALAGQIIFLRGGGGGGGYLLQDEFEAADGTNITAHGWTAIGTDPGDYIEIDTAQKNGGSSSVLIDGNANATEYIVYKSFTQQTSGKFTVSVYFRTTDVTTVNQIPIFIIHASNDDNNANRVAAFYQETNDLSTIGATLANDVFAINTWYHLEVEFNMDTNKYDVWLNSTEYNNSGNYWAFEQNVDPAYIYLQKRPVSLWDGWVDDLYIYSGARIP